ncbi:MAG: hypothetical protein AB1Z19_08360 [Eubacteriales bacterium]
MKHKLKWYSLDTSAKIYPAIESRTNPAIFRMALTLDEEIDEEDLSRALNDIKNRFPSFNVHIKRGLFWHYLEENVQPLLVWPETASPCERMYPEFNNGYLYKAKFFKNTISLDVFHVLTDGYGAMMFLKNFAFRYLQIRGKISEEEKAEFDYREPPTHEETEDAFLKVAAETTKPDLDKDRSLFNSLKSFKIPTRMLSATKNKVITGVASVADLKVAARKYDATITQLVAALYMEAMIHLQVKTIRKKKNHRAVSVQIPVNMRNMYPYKTLRNFSLFVVAPVNPRKVKEFPDIVTAIKEAMEKQITQDFLLAMIFENCELSTNPVLTHVPLVLKNLVIRYVANTQGATQYAGTISNLGVVKFEESLKKHIQDVNFVLAPSESEKCPCSMAGYDGKVYITFSRNIKETEIERHVFRRLVKMGVHVKIKSND